MLVDNDEDKILNQLKLGVNKLCIDSQCNNCPFYTDSCVFGDIKPRDWYKEKPTFQITNQIVLPAEMFSEEEFIEEEPATEEVVQEEKQEEVKEEVKEPDKSEEQTKILNTVGTWEIRAPVEKGLLSKYIFVCSKCGYQRESLFSTPIGLCPECENKKYNI